MDHYSLNAQFTEAYPRNAPGEILRSGHDRIWRWLKCLCVDPPGRPGPGILSNLIQIDKADMTDLPVPAANSPKDPRHWHDDGWTARVIKNEDDDGWAVEMIKDGEPEPALVGPWTMGRDKKNPKPLDASAFHTLVKTAYEVRRRHEQHLHATLHKKVVVSHAGNAITVTLEIVPDDENPYAMLTARAARNRDDPPLAQVRVAASFKLNEASAGTWIEGDFRRPE